FDVGASEDITFTARRGSVAVTGPVHLEAGDRIRVDARGGDVTIAPDDPTFEPEFTMLAGNRLDVLAKSANGSIDIARARLGAHRVTLTTRANLSFVGEKELRIEDGTELTTDLADLGVSAPTAGDVVLDATGEIRV